MERLVVCADRTWRSWDDRSDATDVERLRVAVLGISGPLGRWTRRRWGLHGVPLSGRAGHGHPALAAEERRRAVAPTRWWMPGRAHAAGLELDLSSLPEVTDADAWPEQRDGAHERASTGRGASSSG